MATHQPRLMAVPTSQGYGDNMDTTALEVRLREGQEHVELAKLTHTLDEVRLALREIDRVYIVRGSRPKWVVSDLRYSSADLIIRVTAAETASRERQSLLTPVDALVSGVKQLQHVPEVPQYFSEATVERLLKIGTPGKGLQMVSFAKVNGKPGMPVAVSEPVRNNARLAVAGSQESFGSVSGWLDQMNARRLGKGVMVVGLYDPLTKRAVVGHVPAGMEETVESHWRRRVLARGIVTRNDRGQVVRIKIDHLEVLPMDDGGRASVSDLLGAAPDWLGGQSVDDYIQEARRA